MPPLENLQSFLRDNPAAWRFVAKAKDDYLLARIGILHQMSSAFHVATQAVEKLLKGYLLFTDCSLGKSAEAVRHAVSKKSKQMGRLIEASHNIEAALTLATAAGLTCSETTHIRIKRINSFHAMRYPYGGGPSSYGGQDLHELDEVVFEIWDNFVKIHDEFYLVCGPLAPAYGYALDAWHGHKSGVTTIHYNYLVSNNKALAERSSQIQISLKDLLEKYYTK